MKAVMWMNVVAMVEYVAVGGGTLKSVLMVQRGEKKHSSQ